LITIKTMDPTVEAPRTTGLPEAQPAASSFQDTSTECAICLLPLDGNDDIDHGNGNDDDDDDDAVAARTIITLTCGHRWHLDCIKQQLEHARPNPAKRLVFTGCTCAKCGTVCSDHPQLQHVARQVDSLRLRVQALIQEQVGVEIENNENDGQNNTTNQELLDRAWKKYAFYLCANCQEPYFGGTIECADQVDGEIIDAKDRLCETCRETATRHSSGDGIIICRHVAQHRSFLVWKCRYCCRPANFVCYGNVHFCESCHERNTKRVQQQQDRQRQQQYPAATAAPPPLEPIPCPGGAACPFPKPRNASQSENQQQYHVNVPTSDGEQIYGCTLCQSAARNVDGTSSRWHIPEGSRNLILNSSGQDGLRHWQQPLRRHQQLRGGGMVAWQVETSDLLPAVPALAATGTDTAPLTTNFVSSFHWCSMGQLVPLHQYVRDPNQVRIEVAAQYMGRTDCPSVFRLEAVVLNRQGRPVHRLMTDILPTPQDDWDRASLILEPQQQQQQPAHDNHNNNSAHSLLMIVHGKDTRFWQGMFGAKVADCSVRILGSSQLLQEQMMLEDGVDEVPVANHVPRQGMAFPLFQRRRQQEQQQQQQLGNGGRPIQRRPLDRGIQLGRRPVQRNPEAWNHLFQQTVLPIVVFFLFLWLFATQQQPTY
jgi:hypothetical protein